MAPTHGSVALQVLAGLLVAAAFVLFGWACLKRFLMLRAGRPENRFDQLGRRFGDFVGLVFGQRLVLRERLPGTAHVLIFWGFLVVAAANLVFMIEGFWEGFRIPYVTDAGWYHFIFDVFVVLVIVGVAVAFLRRVILRPTGPTGGFGAYFILFLIFILMFTDLVIEGYLLGTAGVRPASMPAGSLSAALFAGLGLIGPKWFGLYAVSWWVHLVALLVFLVYIPMSKHLHLLAGPFNEFFRDLKPRGVVRDCDVEDEDADHFGVVRADEFTWRQLLDLYACVECGRCQDNCPAFNTDKPLSPKKVITDLKHDFMHYGLKIAKLARAPVEKEEGVGLAGPVVNDDELWACTTCMACVEHCPINVEHVDKIVDLRRDLVLNEGRVPHELNAAMNGVERNNNPYGLPSADRMKWANGMGVPVFAKGAEAEYCFWVSCLGSYDDRGQRVARAMVKLLDAAGVSYAVLGEEEGCCAEAFRRLGHEYLYKMKLDENAAAFEQYGIKKLITACPHCYNTFKHEYASLGHELEVYHHTEFLKGLVDDGKLEITGDPAGAVAYHDSCYLGRYNGLYDAPRELVRAAGGEPVEFERNRSRAFCCGAGGGRMWLEETIGKRINVERAEQALATGASTVAVACAYCLTMLDDGVKDLNAGVPVQDVAELLAKRL
ncbi:MAG: (Fe-S)-binding protein [Candidatus Zixiibacteriota bacterium]|jgi:Fe-S oxidoreductase